MARAGLSRDRVVAAAAVLADEVGLDRLTLAAVAARLGVTVPSLYKHVRGTGGLHRDLALLASRELTAALTAATVGRAGRDALHAAATAFRDYGTAHPGRIAAVVRAPDLDDAEHTAAAAEAVELIAAALAGYDIDPDARTDAIRALRATVHGFVLLETAGGFGLPRSVDASFDRLVDALDTAFRSWAVRA